MHGLEISIAELNRLRYERKTSPCFCTGLLGEKATRTGFFTLIMIRIYYT
jgi:hypothetical protein